VLEYTESSRLGEETDGAVLRSFDLRNDIVESSDLYGVLKREIILNSIKAQRSRG